MVKKIVVTLPVYVKKFFFSEYDGYTKKNGIDEIHVDKNSELGKLIHLISRPIPFTQKRIQSDDPGTLSIRYYIHVQAYEVPNDKLPLLAQYMDEIFRRSLICEVRGGHELALCDYGPLVTESLKRRGIERDVDIDYQTARKIYRDYIAKNNRKKEKSYA
ncbi:hypothetical protein SAMN04487996_12261 [Dyadobacter soli]|uniref:Uncharacterized protein n=1 Tax=Dyadobacter soli TaxID=659014 RepID=A0A1G7WKU7_9BACT|nr:hypothetical protein [Dyadobacter soli]SDG71820.1 hypothetical protein SAMN04487996_12261 [Dyadobacter soli]